ncbi:hypothetical protein Tco_0700277 [Tanacetum coccineum]
MLLRKKMRMRSLLLCLVKQFWQTASALTLADGTLELRATIDTLEYTITEVSIRSKLQLADASGISMLPNTEIFEGIGNMGKTEVPQSQDSYSLSYTRTKLIDKWEDLYLPVKKVKKMEDILKRRHVVLTDSEDQGRIIQDIDDDPLVSKGDFITPTKPSSRLRKKRIIPNNSESS